jgi:predicted Ser/Thr protein kinase
MRTEVRCRECGCVYDGAVVEGRFGGACPRCVAKFALATEAAAPTVGDEPLPLKPGATFRGLEVQDVLGRGGMGVVYRARQMELGRAVALKVLSPTLAADAEFAERFQREARAMASLSHPNIVHVYDFGREGDIYFLAMEYVDGVSLRSLMGEGRLETAKALAIVPQICEALEYAHAQGVVHRDIKPENVLVDKAGRVKIADFGLAKVLGARAMPTLTRTDVAMGTPQYMAPEQYASMKDVDHRADIYSLGVVFYEMLTGELPAGAFEPPSKKAAVDARLDGVVLKAMAKEPERRYQRALHVKTDIETVSSRPAAASGSDGLFERLAEALAPDKLVPVPDAKFAGLGCVRALHRPGWFNDVACLVVDVPESVRDAAAARELRETLRREVERALGGWFGGPRTVLIVRCSAGLWSAVRDAGMLFRDRAGMGSTNFVAACVVNCGTGEVLRQRSWWMESALGATWFDRVALETTQWANERWPGAPRPVAAPAAVRAPEILATVLTGLMLVTALAIADPSLKVKMMGGLAGAVGIAGLIATWRAGIERRSRMPAYVAVLAVVATAILVPHLGRGLASMLAYASLCGYGLLTAMCYAAGAGGADARGRLAGGGAIASVVAGGVLALLTKFPGPAFLDVRTCAWVVGALGVAGLALGGAAVAYRRYVAAAIAGIGALACVMVSGRLISAANGSSREPGVDRMSQARQAMHDGGLLAFGGRWAEAQERFVEAERLGDPEAPQRLALVRKAVELKREAEVTTSGDRELERRRLEAAGRLKDIGLQCTGADPATLEDFVVTPERGPEGLTLRASPDPLLPVRILDRWEDLQRLRDAVYPRADFSRVTRAYRALFDTGAAFIVLEFPDAESVHTVRTTPGGTCMQFTLGLRLLGAVYQTSRRPWVSEQFVVDWINQVADPGRRRAREARVEDFLLDDVDLPRGVRFATAASTASDPAAIAALLAKAGLNNVAADEVNRAYLAPLADEGGTYAFCVLDTKGDAPVVRLAESAIASSTRRAWWAHGLVAVLGCAGTPDARRRARLERVIEARCAAATGRQRVGGAALEALFEELPAGWTLADTADVVRHEPGRTCCDGPGFGLHVDYTEEHRWVLRDPRGRTARVTACLAHSNMAVGEMLKRVREAMKGSRHEEIESDWAVLVVEADDLRLTEWVRRRLCLSRGDPEAVFEK